MGKGKLEATLAYYGAPESVYKILVMNGISSITKFSMEPLENIKDVINTNAPQYMEAVSNAYFDARGHFKAKRGKLTVDA